MAALFKIKALRDDHGQVIGLQPDTPEGSQEPLQPEQLARLSYAANVQDFLKAWAWGEWNEMRIRVVGAMPVITTWVNGVKIAQLDTATMQAPNYDPDAILEMLGTRGHIALEVHDNDPIFKDRAGAMARNAAGATSAFGTCDAERQMALTKKSRAIGSTKPL
jgi:hypothetical protein